MFRRKLDALNYEFVDEFNFKDSKHFRQMIAWIEDQKIRHYRIEERFALRDVSSNRWDTAYHKYLSDIDCPFDGNQIELVLDWILTLAIRLEFEDNLEEFHKLKTEDIRREPQVVQNNPIDNLDFNSDHFKEGIKQLAKLLKVSTHPTNHLITLRAITLIIRNHFSNEFKDTTQQKSNENISKRSQIEDNSLPLKVGNDFVLNKCAKILRLLYVQDLRQLQTNINEIIASVQSITSNPKTDTTLGKVGI